MKKYLIAIMLFMGVVPAGAWENPGFEWEVGAELNSAYLYRGFNYGGLCLQPEAMVGYGGLKLTAWGNIGATDYGFNSITPELDLTLSYSIFGLSVGVTQLYYFGGTKFFDFKGEEEGGPQTEVFATFELGELLEDFPLSVGWYTYVAGDDFIDDERTKRAYSSYCEVSYEAELPHGFYITPTVGFTPWQSCYNYYIGNFNFNNISARVGWALEIGKHLSLDVYAEGMLNTTGINRENVITSLDERYEQRMNGRIGVGIWLF